MLNTTGLSLQQAPPIHIPFRFFLTAPVFLLVAAWILGWQGDAVLASRWSPAALAVTHLIVIGFLGQIMCGALLQLLPVIAGAPVPAVILVGTAVNILLSAGAGLLAWGFLGGGPGVLGAGAVCTAFGFLVFLMATGLALTQARGVADTIRAIGLALAALLVTVIAGLLLAGALIGLFSVRDIAIVTDVHLIWGILGWVGLLIIGVAYQVVPMFHVTPPYPGWIERFAAPVVFIALVAVGLLAFSGWDAIARGAVAPAVAAFVLFAAVTCHLQLRRERKRLDATLLHWWTAMACIVAAGIAWGLSVPPVPIGILILYGVGIGLPSGMLMKIVPFLAWFHLQHRQLATGNLAVRVPHMLKFLPDNRARLHYACHLLGLMVLIAGWAVPALRPVAAVVLGLSAVGLGWLLLSATTRFRRVSTALGAVQSSAN